MLTGWRAARAGHGRSLRGKRDGQLPGAAEKTAVRPKPQPSLPRVAQAVDAARLMKV
jgi:hypothetical protein